MPSIQQHLGTGMASTQIYGKDEAHRSGWWKNPRLMAPSCAEVCKRAITSFLVPFCCLKSWKCQLKVVARCLRETIVDPHRKWWEAKEKSGLRQSADILVKICENWKGGIDRFQYVNQVASCKSFVQFQEESKVERCLIGVSTQRIARPWVGLPDLTNKMLVFFLMKARSNGPDQLISWGLSDWEMSGRKHLEGSKITIFLRNKNRMCFLSMMVIWWWYDRMWYKMIEVICKCCTCEISNDSLDDGSLGLPSFG